MKEVMGVLALIVFFFTYLGIYHIVGGYVFTTLYFIGLIGVLLIANRGSK